MVNKNVIEYKNLCAFHPGYYIEELVEEYGITQNEFALRMGTTPKTLSELINGIANLSNDLAKKTISNDGNKCRVMVKSSKFI